MDDREFLDSLGIPTIEKPIVGESYHGTPKSGEVASWLQEKLKDLNIGATIGGTVGAGIGTLPPILGATGGTGPFIGGAGGAMVGQGIEDIIRSGGLDAYNTTKAGLTGLAGPAIGKVGMGLGALARGTATMTSNVPTVAKNEVLRRIIQSLIPLGSSWGSYQMSGGSPAAASAGAAAGIGVPYAYNLAKALYKIGNWNPYASMAGTFGAEYMLPRHEQPEAEIKPTEQDVQDILRILGETK